MRADLATRLGIKQCRAIDADTGRRCCLLASHVTTHATPRGPFNAVAAEGQTTFTRDAQFTHAANSQPQE